MRHFMHSSLLGILAVSAACGSDTATVQSQREDAGTLDAAVDEWQQKLNERETDFTAALKAAAMRLLGAPPTLREIEDLKNAGDLAAQKTAYQSRIRDYIADPRFKTQMYEWWKDTLRMGDLEVLNSAAAFAAQVTIEGRSYRELFTAKTGQCARFNPITATFEADDCQNGVPVHAGLLTHPGVMRHFFGSLAFRRVNWIQETFACSRFPAELVEEPTDVGGAAPYLGAWPFESISGTETGRINFRDTGATICANCHGTINHIAPLFAYFDEQGQYQSEMSVPVPIEGAPSAAMSDYVVPGEITAWRVNSPAADLPALGAAIADDPAIANCAIARVWNWAFGKEDIVDGNREVPPEVIAEQVDAFVADDMRLREAIYRIFTSDDFTKF